MNSRYRQRSSTTTALRTLRHHPTWVRQRSVAGEIVEYRLGPVGGGGPVRYEFLIAGQVSDIVNAAFPELDVVAAPTGGTAMYGPVRDASHLRGLLARFDDLGVSVVEMRQLPD
jgi:hypothetical protein